MQDDDCGIWFPFIGFELKLFNWCWCRCARTWSKNNDDWSFQTVQLAMTHRRRLLQRRWRYASPRNKTTIIFFSSRKLHAKWRSHRSLFAFGSSYLTTLLRGVNATKQRNNTIIAAGYAALVKVIINHRSRRRCNVARLRTVYAGLNHCTEHANGIQENTVISLRNGTEQNRRTPQLNIYWIILKCNVLVAIKSPLMISNTHTQPHTALTKRRRIAVPQSYFKLCDYINIIGIKYFARARNDIFVVRLVLHRLHLLLLVAIERHHREQAT